MPSNLSPPAIAQKITPVAQKITSKFTPQSKQEDVPADVPFSVPNSVSILVDAYHLQSALDNGLTKVDPIDRIKFRLRKKRVNVEAAVGGTKDNVFFAPDTPVVENCRATPTEFIKVYPDKATNVVRRGDDFDISFVGMSVIAFDVGFAVDNELLLYSLVAKPADSDEGNVPSLYPKPDHTSDSSLAGINGVNQIRPEHSDASLASVASGATTSTKSAKLMKDVPYIHYDPKVDGHEKGTEPDAFVTIPARKRLYLRSSDDNMEKTVFIRFNVMEIDAVSEAQVAAITGIGKAGDMAASASTTMPYLAPLSNALNVASSLGKKGLQNYAKPDHVMSKDIQFKLAEPLPVEHSADGEETVGSAIAEPLDNYLRYGYYFFLNKKIDARLFAQTGSSSQSVPLLLKRVGFDPVKAPQNEKEHFPLTGVSYVVLKVSKGCTTDVLDERPLVREEHQQRLDGMLQMNDMIEMFANMEKKKK